MKQSSPPSRTSARSSSNARPTKPKTTKPPLSANERGVQRRAQKKTERRRKSWLSWLGFAAATAVVAGTAFGVSSRYVQVKGIMKEYSGVKARVANKQDTLKALKAQLERGQKRLSSFHGGSGRERALAENGFVRPGERILLYPRDKEKENER